MTLLNLLERDLAVQLLIVGDVHHAQAPLGVLPENAETHAGHARLTHGRRLSGVRRHAGCRNAYQAGLQIRVGHLAKVLGLATDYCVVETALDARRLGFEVTALLAGIRAVDLQPGDGYRALARMREAGAELV